MLTPRALVIITLLQSASPSAVLAQQQENSGKFSSWLPYQAIPGLSWTTFPGQTNFSFEWRAAPLLYSFGMTKLVSPWYSFIVEPPARFTGSIELDVTIQLYTSKPGSSYFAFSGQLIGHIPLVERGEHLALTVGAAKYSVADSSPLFGVAGLSTLFGFVNLNLKYSPDPRIWMTSFEIRVF